MFCDVMLQSLVRPFGTLTLQTEELHSSRTSLHNVSLFLPTPSLFPYSLSSFSLCLSRKGVSEGEVSSEDREHAKRIVYSVVYGAGEKNYPHDSVS